MASPELEQSPYQIQAFENARETSEQIDPLAYEKQPGVMRCKRNPRATKLTPSQPPKDEPLVNVIATVFFDGTNNNMLRDSRSPTNVVKLFDYHEVGWDAATKTLRCALYIRGVGSFDDEATTKSLQSRIDGVRAEQARRLSGLASLKPESSVETPAERGAPENSWWERRKVGVQDTLGGATGRGAADRIGKAYNWVKAQAASATPNGTVSVNAVGFSRGAATARSFWNAYRVWLRKEAPLARLGERARFDFLGLFDTVASFGTQAGESRTPGHNILLTSELGTAVYHAVARDEFRYNFHYNPAEIGEEKLYTGAHSDIGGGYGPGAQGRTNELATIALTDMYDRAKSHLPLVPLPTAVRSMAESLRPKARLFETWREKIWAMAFDLGSDCVYPQIPYRDRDAWREKKLPGLGMMPQCNADIDKPLSDLDLFNEAHEFWSKYIHLPYFLKLSQGVGASEEVGGFGYLVGFMGMKSDDLAPEFERIARPGRPMTPLSGPPNFEWLDTQDSAKHAADALKMSRRGQYD